MTQALNVDVCIVGGGPAGVMAAIKLCRYGLKVALLERSPVFPSPREFRGESISQQSIALLDELGVLAQLAKYNYLRTERMHIVQDGRSLLTVDFTKLPLQHQCPIDIPQPILLQELMQLLSGRENFQLITGAACTALIEEEGAVVGARARTSNGDLEVRSRLVISADGRFTRLRQMARLESKVVHAQRDVIWFKIPRPAEWGCVGKIMIVGGRNLIVLPTYPDLLRVGLSIPSGRFKELRANGLEKFYSIVDTFDPLLGNLTREHVRAVSDLSLLDIFTARTPKWQRKGFVLIGDAAHTLSPILGQGVNQSILDAAYLAPIVYRAMREETGPISEETLRAFQSQRQEQVDFIHGFQSRQEWMLNIGGWQGDWLRSTFYRFIGLFPAVRSALAERLYYSSGVTAHIQDQEQAATSLMRSLASEATS